MYTAIIRITLLLVSTMTPVMSLQIDWIGFVLMLLCAHIIVLGHSSVDGISGRIKVQY